MARAAIWASVQSVAACALCLLMVARTDARTGSFAQMIEQTSSKVVKIFGAGGFRGLEPYQSGFLISPEGHVLTAFSYVLDTDEISLSLDDGRKFSAKLLGADHRLEVALLKIDAVDLPHFDLARTAGVKPGNRVLAFSNLFDVATGDEPVSVQQGVVSVKTQLAAGRGVFKTAYEGPILVLDAVTNNPGAAGGALVNLQGELIGMLGKELRNSQNDTWLNYAVPVEQIKPVLADLRVGKVRPRSEERSLPPEKDALKPTDLGIVLVPNVVDTTPAFIDAVVPGSTAAAAGLKADDRIVTVGDFTIHSCNDLFKRFRSKFRHDKVEITVARGRKLVSVSLVAKPKGTAP